jgi:hypothetical protein
MIIIGGIDMSTIAAERNDAITASCRPVRPAAERDPPP